MSVYVCWKCKKKFKSEELNWHTIRCQYCGGKVLLKQTPPVVRKVSSD